MMRISDSDVLLLASDSDLLDSTNIVQAAQAMVDRLPFVALQLQRFFGTTNVGILLMTHLWLDEKGLSRLGRSDGERTLISDWEWDVTSSLQLRSANGTKTQTDAGQLIVNSASLEAFKHVFAVCCGSKRDAVVFHQLASVFSANKFPGAALELARWGLRLDPDEPDLLADQLIWSLEESAKTIEETVARIEKRSVDAAGRVGVSLWERKLYRQAILVFESLTTLNPQSATAWTNLGVNYQAAGDPQRAKACLERAQALDPSNEFVKRSAMVFLEPP
jgi:tetratricopeptide (TPR) repeat protein